MNGDGLHEVGRDPHDLVPPGRMGIEGRRPPASAASSASQDSLGDGGVDSRAAVEPLVDPAAAAREDPAAALERRAPTSQDELDVLAAVSRELAGSSHIYGALGPALEVLVARTGLSAGWIVLTAPGDDTAAAGAGFTLAAHCNLPEALDVERAEIWNYVCNCSGVCARSGLTDARNEQACPRLDLLSERLDKPLTHGSIPLRWQQQTIGVLNVIREDWEPIDDATLEFLLCAARQIGAAIGRIRLYDKMKLRLKAEQEVLLRLSHDLASHVKLEDFMHQVVLLVNERIACDACALILPGTRPDRLNFGAAVGWRTEPARNRLALRCGEPCHAWKSMQTKEILLIEDLEQTDVESWQNAWVFHEGFRAQAVVPLVAGDAAQGVLVVNSRQAHVWHDDEVALLKIIANHAAVGLESALLREGVTAHQVVEDELVLAQTIQASMLPTALPDFSGWEFALSCEMATTVGGDFYDFLRIPTDPARVGVLIGDAAGKSISGALLMAQGLESIRNAFAQGMGPRDVLMRTNEQISNLANAGRFLTCFLGVLDTRNGMLSYSSAGHEPAFVWRAEEGKLEILESGGRVLGLLPDPRLEERTTWLGPGDHIVLYTDGVTEAMDPDNALFGQKQLETAVKFRVAHAQQLVERVMGAVRTHRGAAHPSDDVTVVAVRRRADDVRAAPPDSRSADADVDAPRKTSPPRDGTVLRLAGSPFRRHSRSSPLRPLPFQVNLWSGASPGVSIAF